MGENLKFLSKAKCIFVIFTRLCGGIDEGASLLLIFIDLRQIHRQLQVANCENWPSESRPTVHRLRFEEGRSSLADDAGSERPNSSTFDQQIEVVKHRVQEEQPKSSLRTLSEDLSFSKDREENAQQQKW